MFDLDVLIKRWARHSTWVDFTPMGRGRVLLATAAGTLFCVTAAILVDSLNFSNLSPEDLMRAVFVDIALPSCLAIPFFYYLMSKIRQLAIAHYELSIVASHDGLTAILNRGAFTMLVDAYLVRSRSLSMHEEGALLVIDADDFKQINDRLGHLKGDQALKTIAETIQGALRGADLVGRIGGEEFGVFLPKTAPAQAMAVAERIRQLIVSADFSMSEREHALSVSIGGVLFENNTSYDELFAVADKRLYAAKAAGKNRIDFGNAIASCGA